MHQKASTGKLELWRKKAHSALAEIIILDQFSRNIFRDTPKAFASDELALQLAQEAIANEFEQELTNQELVFLYMPFMHSESKKIHQISVSLLNKPEMQDAYNYEILHKNIIDKFGRYPHRNKILGRESTQNEIEFLKKDNSSF